MGPRVSLEAGLRIEADGHERYRRRHRQLNRYLAANLRQLLGDERQQDDCGRLCGRFYDSILQGFSDAFASVPQQGNYDCYARNGSSPTRPQEQQACTLSSRTST
jgi:hypothetical protein